MPIRKSPSNKALAATVSNFKNPYIKAPKTREARKSSSSKLSEKTIKTEIHRSTPIIKSYKAPSSVKSQANKNKKEIF